MTDEHRRLRQDLREWMSKHQKADELVFSQISGYPVKAIYYFPFGKYADDEIEQLAQNDPLIAKAIAFFKGNSHPKKEEQNGK